MNEYINGVCYCMKDQQKHWPVEQKQLTPANRRTISAVIRKRRKHGVALRHYLPHIAHIENSAISFLSL